MIKRFSLSKQTNRPHDFGRSFKFDFPIEAIEGYVVGVYACPKNLYIEGYLDGYEVTETETILSRFVNSTFGKVSVSTDNGNVIHSSVPVMFVPALDNINQLFVPVDYQSVGNKFTIVLEEFFETWIDSLVYDPYYPRIDYPQAKLAYELDVYVKLTKRASDVTDINRHRERAFC